MKRLSLAFPVAACLLVLNACGNGEKKTDVSEIDEFEVCQTIKTAERNYKIEMDADTMYLDLYTSVQWPTKLGGADISVLQDSLLRYCYADTARRDVNDMIYSFLDNTSVFDDMPGKKNIVRVDSIPDGDNVRSCFSSVTATVMEITENMATYQVTLSSYLGGAHPYTAIHPFTYDLRNARVLSLSDILTPAGADSVMPVIRTALARQLEVPENRLEQAGIFTSEFVHPGQPYISGNVLYFHYNPYEIAPYSAGMIDVAVYPYEVSAWLKPDARELMEGNY